MAGKQAKTLSIDHIDDLLFFAERSRHPLRNRLIVLLSVKAGLRAAEIAKLSWDMVLGPSGEVGVTIELQDKIAKKGSGRSIPLHRHSRGTHRGTAALPRSGSGYPVGARWRHDADEHRRLVQPAKTTQRHLLRS